MKINFLGTGTSTGNPEIGCKCEVCTSANTKDRRLRASVLLREDGRQLLIDCGPDFRQQILPMPFAKMDGVLITHEHYDHVGGIDDLRPYCKMSNVDIYSNKITLDALKIRMPYCFTENPYPGVPILKLHEVDVDAPFDVAGISVQAIRIMHFNLPICGYRIGNFAYLTDVKHIPNEEYCKLEGLDVLVMSALRIDEHVSHQNLAQALQNVKRIAPRTAYFIHMSHTMGLHDEVQAQLPPNVFLAYDGLEIEI